ncbi:hypothetical protein [Sphingomonas sp.]|uniref:hypothetical protein n=1 Tax=Sphingomonas sp. TaxID=28214 RepID=UPI002DD6236D|nr:hypothetical protein [Sphingomonas sp.]
MRPEQGKLGGGRVVDSSLTSVPGHPGRLSAQRHFSIDWGKVTARSKMEITIHVCPMPPMRRGGPIWQASHDTIRDLGANLARLQFWFPYPQLSIPALDPPADGRTSWDFSLIDPFVLDFHEAAEGRPIMLNMELPRWLLDGGPHRLLDDPDAIDWLYGLSADCGHNFRDSSLEEATDYFLRVAEWYIKGGFTDEYGKVHESGHRLKIDYWEVLNEQDEGRHGHQIPVDVYTRFYDKLVAKLRPLDPDMKFSGLGLWSPENLHYFEHFLNPSNHAPGTPIDMVSYHKYIASPRGGAVEDWHKPMFDKADEFLVMVGKIERMRQRLAPDTKVFISELGVMDGEQIANTKADREGRVTDYSDPDIDDAYWTLGASIHAYCYLGAMRRGVDAVAASELVDYPGQYAGTNLIHWRTGEPNAMYRVIKLLRDNLLPGSDLVDTASGHPDVEAQAFATPEGRKLLLINKTPAPIELPTDLPGGGKAQWVDRDSKSAPPREAAFSGGAVRLGAQAVMLISW